MTREIPGDKIFLLGVGAQKAGTSWLADYLASVPQVQAPFRKELHLFDVLHVPERRHVIARMLRSLAYQSVHGIASAALLRRRPIIAPLNAMRFYARPQAYFAYFERLLRQDGVRLSFDITPMYSGLSAETLRMICDGFAQRGIAMKAVFIVRDPVERYLSETRMVYDHSFWQGKRRRAGESYEQFSARWLDMPVTDIVGRYDRTIEALTAALPQEDLWIDIYERFLTQARFAEFAQWLGTSDTIPKLDDRVYASKREFAVSAALRQRIAAHYADSFRYCDAFFGADVIAKLWPSRALIG